MTTPRMTDKDALAEARRRWGRTAFAECRPQVWRAPYAVGLRLGGTHGAVKHVLGSGLTWERAFFSADNRARGFTDRGRRAKHAPAPSLFDQGGRP